MTAPPARIPAICLIMLLLFMPGCGAGGGGTSSLSGSAAPGYNPSQDPAANPYPSSSTAAVTIADIQPRVLNAGDTCTITGENFGADRGVRVPRAVNFGSIPAVSYTLWSATRIICTVPGGIPSGPLTITITGGDGFQSITNGGFVVTIGNGGANPYPAPSPSPTTQAPPSPLISGIEPRELRSGDQCTITGENFGAARGAKALRTAVFGTTPSTTYASWGDRQIVCTVPGGLPAGLTAVKIKVDTGTDVSSSNEFLVAIVAPPAGGGAAPPEEEENYFVTSFGGSGAPPESPEKSRAAMGAPGNGQLFKPGGVAVDSSGNVYVADTGNNRIQKFDTANLYLAGYGTLGTGNTAVNSPYGIAGDTSGTMFIADTMNNRILKWSAAGGYVSKWGTAGSGTGQFNWPTGVAVDPAGNVFVADLVNNRVLKFNGSGVQQATSETNVGLTLKWPFSVAIDSGGYVYVADSGNHCIRKFDSNLVYQSAVGTPGSPGAGDGQFRNPYGVAIDKKFNMLYVADTGNSRVQKLTTAGTFVTKWGSQGSGDNNFFSPYGIAVSYDAVNGERIYVADTGKSSIVAYGFSLTPLASWLTMVTGAGDGLPDETASNPWSITIDSANSTIYVADTQSHGTSYYVKQYTNSPTDPTRVDFTKRSPGSSFRPSADGGPGLGLGIDSANRVYVANSLYNRIDAGDMTTWGTVASGLSSPRGVAVDAAGLVYVANTSGNAVNKYNAGTLAATITGVTGVTDVIAATETGFTYPVVYAVFNGTTKSINKYTTTNGTAYTLNRTIGSGTMTTPTGMSMDASGALYVADTGGKAILRFASDGTFLGKATTWSAGADTFDAPNDVCSFFSPSALTTTLYVADGGTKDRVVKFRASCEFKNRFGNYGNDDGQFKYPTGIAVSSDGARAYAVDRYNHRIQRFDSSNTKTPPKGPFTFKQKFGTRGSGTDNLSYPFGIALKTVGASDILYITDTGNNRIVMVMCDTLSGTFSTATPYGSAGTSDGSFDTPCGITLDAAGNLYVADTFNHRVQVFSTSSNDYTITSFLATIGKTGGGTGSGNGEFAYPYGVAVDSAGIIYVADSDNQRIQKFTAAPACAYSLQWGSAGTGNGLFNSPMGIAVNSKNLVFVADTNNHRVQKFNANGKFQKKTGTFGSGTTNLNTPYSITINTKTNYEYVTDTFNHRVQVLSPL